MLEPFTSNEEAVTPIARYASFNSKTLNPRFTIILSEEVADRVIPADEREISIERIVFFKVGVVSFIDRSIGSELLVDLFEELVGAEVIVGTEHHTYLPSRPLNTNGFRGLRVAL